MEYLFVHALHDSERQLSDFRTQELDSIATLIDAPVPIIPPHADLVTHIDSLHAPGTPQE